MAFIHGALDKEIRLSFAQRIRGTLPDPYQELITEGKEKDTPDFKYMSDSKLNSLYEPRFFSFFIPETNILITSNAIRK
ncbi:hypothetical protein GCM10020218_045030 [Dactylosporangium vinaceum]